MVETIPTANGWEKRFVKDIGDVVTGRTPNTKCVYYYGGEYNLVSPADLGHSKYIITAHRRLTLEGFNQCRKLPKDTVLVSCIGNIGKTGMVGDDKTATNQQINAVICNRQHDPSFIFFCFLYNQKRLEQAADKTTLPIINKTNFERFQLCIPPLPEQRKIAAVLNLVQQAIEQQEQLIDLTTNLKKALMHKLFTEGLRGEPQKETEIGLIPESWRVDSMKSFISNSKYGLSIKGQDSGSIPILRMTNQVEGYIDTHNLQYVDITNDVLEKYRVCRGDLLFNRTNSFELVGRTALFDIDGDFVFASYLIRITVDMQQMMPEFINFYLNWDKMQQRLKSIATRSVSQSNISASRLGKFLVAIPPMDEQLALVDVFQTLDDKRKLHLRNRFLLNDLFQSLLHQLMTAQIRVNDLDLSGLEEQLKE